MYILGGTRILFFRVVRTFIYPGKRSFLPFKVSLVGMAIGIGRWGKSELMGLGLERELGWLQYVRLESLYTVV